MKIALIAPVNFPISRGSSGGLESFIFELSKGLVELDQDVTLFAPGGSAVPGVKIIPICERGVQVDDDFSLAYTREYIKAEMVYNFRLMRKILSGQGMDYDVYHINTYNIMPIAMQVLDDQLYRKCVSTIHTAISGIFIRNCREILEEDISKINFINISDFQAKGAKNLNINCSARIYNGIKLEDFEFDPNPDGYIGWLGRIVFDKGIGVAAKIASKNNWDFKFAGPIQDKSYFDKQVKPYLSNNINYVNEVFGKDKSDFYKKCAVFVAPIQWDEPFGLTIIEAMACGTPVVAFNRGAMSELIIDGVTGYLVEPGDDEGFAKAVEKAKLLDRKKCREHVEKYFTLNRMCGEYLEVYKSLLKPEV
jgi:glycosyltransferase involved in cell wall biosynthesis